MNTKIGAFCVGAGIAGIVAVCAAVPASVDRGAAEGSAAVRVATPPAAWPVVCGVVRPAPAGAVLLAPGREAMGEQERAPGQPTPTPQRELWPFEIDAARARELAQMIVALQPDVPRWLVSEIAYYTAKYTRNMRSVAEIPPEVFISLICEESFFRPNARGASGEMGMVQILPSTARRQGYDVQRLRRDVGYQIECGVAYLAGCVRSAGGDLREGLARYNGGQRPGRRSYAYADRVLRRAERFMRQARESDVAAVR